MSGGSGEGRQWAGPRQVTLAVPGPRMREGGLTPNAGSTALVPSPLTKLQMGQASGTALPSRTLTHRHAGTLSYHNVKIKGWNRGEGKKKKKKIFQCLLLGTPGTQVVACALGRGRLALKESSMGAGGYRVGTSTEIMYKEGGCPTQPPIGLDWLMGVGVCRGNCPTQSVPT